MSRLVLYLLIVLLFLSGLIGAAVSVVELRNSGISGGGAIAVGVVALVVPWLLAAGFAVVLGTADTIERLTERLVDLEDLAWPDGGER